MPIVDGSSDPAVTHLQTLVALAHQLNVADDVGGPRLRRTGPGALGFNAVDAILQPFAVGVVDKRNLFLRVAGQLVIVALRRHPVDHLRAAELSHSSTDDRPADGLRVEKLAYLFEVPASGHLHALGNGLVVTLLFLFNRREHQRQPVMVMGDVQRFVLRFHPA